MRELSRLSHAALYDMMMSADAAQVSASGDFWLAVAADSATLADDLRRLVPWLERSGSSFSLDHAWVRLEEQLVHADDSQHQATVVGHALHAIAARIRWGQREIEPPPERAPVASGGSVLDAAFGFVHSPAASQRSGRRALEIVTGVAEFIEERFYSLGAQGQELLTALAAHSDRERLEFALTPLSLFSDLTMEMWAAADDGHHNYDTIGSHGSPSGPGDRDRGVPDGWRLDSRHAYGSDDDPDDAEPAAAANAGSDRPATWPSVPDRADQGWWGSGAGLVGDDASGPAPVWPPEDDR